LRLAGLRVVCLLLLLRLLQGVNAVVFSGFGAAHRVAVDLGMEPGWPLLDRAYQGLLSTVRDRS
jgi:prolycopene isomerase